MSTEGETQIKCLGCPVEVASNAKYSRCPACAKEYYKQVTAFIELMQVLNPPPVKDKTKCEKGHERAVHEDKWKNCLECARIRRLRKEIGNGSIW